MEHRTIKRHRPDGSVYYEILDTKVIITCERPKCNFTQHRGLWSQFFAESTLSKVEKKHKEECPGKLVITGNFTDKPFEANIGGTFGKNWF